KGRRYDIKNIAEGKDLVMVELIESYSNPKTKRVYHTPLVLVLEMKNGKICQGPRVMCKHIWRFPLQWGDGYIYVKNN
ncbi:MAG: nuclear transport factor 2 family protein, partial [Patescibacteria group bacterium]